jgi:hypothetical protein
VFGVQDASADQRADGRHCAPQLGRTTKFTNREATGFEGAVDPRMQIRTDFDVAMFPDALAIARARFRPDHSRIDLNTRDGLLLQRDQQQALGIYVALGPFVDDVVCNSAFVPFGYQHSNRNFLIGNEEGSDEPQRSHRRVEGQLNGEPMEVGRASGPEHAPALARKKIDRSIPTELEGYLHRGSSPTRRIGRDAFRMGPVVLSRSSDELHPFRAVKESRRI